MNTRSHRLKAFSMIRNLFAILLLFGIYCDILPGDGFLGISTPCLAQTAPKYAEGNDFATQVLRDPWDMNEYSDISQYINQSGQGNFLQDIKVENGAFSARSIDDAQFFPLFPGYNTAMLIGKVGHNYPIQSSKYKMLYIAMKVDSGAPAPWPDMFQIMWFADERLNGPGGIWGFSKFITLYPEAGTATPNPIWKLFKIDLSAGDNSGGGTPWTGSTVWQGLRIDPTMQKQVNFQVDWIRLTDSQPVNFPIPFNGVGADFSIWIVPAGTNREILVQTGISSPFNLDLQGIAPGTYTYLIKNGSAVIKSGTFEINQAPIANFIRPSPTGSEDYASLTGNPWNMADASDAGIECAEYQFKEGKLNLTTPAFGQQGGVCDGDPKINLNVPVPFQPGEYRYLSFRMHTAGSWQNVPQGMMARWIWTVPGNGGNCHFVSQDIPFDVGWQTYTIDLFDSFNGSPEEVSGQCPFSSWKDAPAVIGLRFDPNENILGYPLFQSIDWIKLYKGDRIPRGVPFPVKIALNKPPEGTVLSYYYTTDPKNHPQQQAAQVYLSAPALSNGNYRLFLPIINSKFDTSDMPPPNSVTYSWDTASVPAGDYYICVSATDSLNQTTICSDVPVRII
jgi:hypothetical protein